jgi:hypothetical protein
MNLKIEILTRENPTANSTFTIGGVTFPLDSFMVTESSIPRINFYAEEPANRKAANLCVCFVTPQPTIETL